MILFKPEHVDLILAGEKTETRRLGKKRWNVGAVHLCGTKLFGGTFARVKILDVYEERLGDMGQTDIAAEGYAGKDYKAAWERINKKPWDDDEVVWVVMFEVVDCPDCWGLGYIPGSSFVKCPRCKGSSKFQPLDKPKGGDE